VTSGEFSSCLVDAIIVERDARQRRELRNIRELADSIRRLGLIHPIVVDREFRLVAGERRLAACRSLGWTSISFQYLDTLDWRERELVEYEENIKRDELPWPDRAQFIQKYHELRSTEEGWIQGNSAKALGMSPNNIKDWLLVAKDLPQVQNEPRFSTALGIVQRTAARARDAAEAELYGSYRNGTDHTSGPVGPVVCVDFREWVRSYDGLRFNFIHCDFPYGIGSDEFGQGATHMGRYEDTEEVFWGLIRTLVESGVAVDSCHFMLWYSMPNYGRIVEALGPDWRVDPFPLVWVKSDNVGILPDPSRGPRRVYETCLFGSRGDRRIVRAKANAYCGPTTGTIHPHEKPQAMLEHFMEMFVDEHSVVLDPTAGSGSALRAARRLGAGHVVGVEKDPEFAGLANREWERIVNGNPTA
jgi:ParB/RepB/Spo0J family partition protein